MQTAQMKKTIPSPPNPENPMTTQAEIEEFARKSHERAMRRFLAIPELPTGFYLPGEFATKAGREVLVQVRDFEETL
jgi:hypothetical protein